MFENPLRIQVYLGETFRDTPPILRPANKPFKSISPREVLNNPGDPDMIPKNPGLFDRQSDIVDHQSYLDVPGS